MKKILLLIIAITAFANAELRSVKFTPEEEKNDGIKALVGIGGGNSMIADDGTIFMSLRIGIDLNPLLSTGMWYVSTISDVRNYNVPQKQLVNYNSFGAFVELFPIRISDFAISVPVRIGGGAINTLENGDEGFQSEDYVFIADMAVHFNYRITKMLEVSIGGGYRMFAGVEENNLENLDFCTPFGELRFTIRE
ncbi:hypothetical protein [uncultured Fibrobacter sp.]|uniref:hypothetical protein n=1 Tax=uncultured Fibrobacter sp. TaxID=261512 RepID=UPI00262C4F56|nr:hypothetical protein [uncultured Fibrobacter sp.]